MLQAACSLDNRGTALELLPVSVPCLQAVGAASKVDASSDVRLSFEVSCWHLPANAPILLTCCRYHKYLTRPHILCFRTCGPRQQLKLSGATSLLTSTLGSPPLQTMTSSRL